MHLSRQGAQRVAEIKGVSAIVPVPVERHIREIGGIYQPLIEKIGNLSTRCSPCRGGSYMLGREVLEHLQQWSNILNLDVKLKKKSSNSGAIRASPTVI